MDSGERRSNEEILGELLSVTEEAIRAARIDHRTEVQRLLDRRERLLAMLWSLEPSSALPEYGNGEYKAVPPTLSFRGKSVLKKVTSLDNKLLGYMNSNRERLLSEQNVLRRGERAISGLRHLIRDGKTGGKRVDVRG